MHWSLSFLVFIFKQVCPNDAPALFRFLLPPPPRAPYDLQQDCNLPSVRTYLAHCSANGGWQTLHLLVVALFEGQPAGVFVEAGPVDCEYLSNTIYPERPKDWFGLLLEPDGGIFAALLTKHGRAWASHSCLATNNFPSQVSATN